MHPVRRSAAATPLRASLSVIALAVCASGMAVPASGAPSYSIRFERSGYGAQYDVTQGTPFENQDSYPVPGSIDATFSGSAFSYPGHVGVRDHVQVHWTGLGTSSRYDVYSSAKATDFVITGPPATQVAGQLHLRVRARMEHVGGYAGNGGHGTRVNVDARARFNQLVVLGDMMANNFDTFGTGVLAGLTDPNLDCSFVLPGNFPVGTPFDVYIRMFSIGTVYGNGASDPNPAHVSTDASGPDEGLYLEEVSGQIMTLPAGYTLSSASWGIVDNRFDHPLDVAASEGGLTGLTVRPNPAAGEVRLALHLSAAATTRVAVYDVTGRRVRLLNDARLAAGRHELVWDGRTDDGTPAVPGLYFARAEVGGHIVSRRIVRVR